MHMEPKEEENKSAQTDQHCEVNFVLHFDIFQQQWQQTHHNQDQG